MYGRTALHGASVEAGSEEAVELLLDYGADVDAKDKYGNTPLHDAAKYGNISICKLLLGYGADIDAANKWGQTPMHVAAFERQEEVFDFLIRSGADDGAKDNDLNSPYDVLNSRKRKNR